MEAEALVAAVTAGLLTLFDLDRTFYVPEATKRKVALYGWWWAFVLINAALAAGLYGLVRDVDSLRDLDRWLRAVAVGAGYLALIRVKFTTFTYHGQEVPFGIEAFYEGAKEFVYKRINQIAKAARYVETTALAQKESLADLATRASLSIEQDALLSAEDKRASKAWILRVLNDQQATDLSKRLTLADFLLSGFRSSDIA